MTAIANMYRQRIASLHLAQHVYAGESRTLVFEKLDADNVPRSLFEINEFEYSELTATGTKLPPDVDFELRISELVFDPDLHKGVCSILHGDRRFGIVSPSPFAPSGADRFWRFWLAPKEDED